MKTSARNQFSGTVLAVKPGAVNSEISIGLPGGQTLTATVTNESCQELALAQGRAVIALVKSSHIIVATDLAHIRLSARNQIEGIIEHIERGAVNALVSINAGEGVCLTAGITIQSAENLDLHPGQRATAIFKAGSVILGVLV